MLIDVTRLLTRALRGRLPTGVDRVSQEYLRHFRAKSRALVRFGGRWLVLGTRDSQAFFSMLINQCENSTRKFCWIVIKNYLLNWELPADREILLNTGHSGLHQGGYARRIMQFGLRPLYFLHDLIPITHPEYCRAGEAERHLLRIRMMLDTGCGVILNSAATAKVLEDYASRLGWKLPPFVIAPLAPGRLPAPAVNRPVCQPYFVVLGTIEPRKNHLLLLQLWKQLAEEFGDDVPRLVIIGQRGWECEQVVDILERCAVLRGVVIELSSCNDIELVTWLAHAKALLFPSFEEGYGLPLVEAISMGIPAIVSDIPTFREVGQGVPEYLSPIAGLAWKRTVLDYMDTESPSRHAQIERMGGWRAPSWDAHFRHVDEAVNRWCHFRAHR